jgi:hypothetical protein
MRLAVASSHKFYSEAKSVVARLQEHEFEVHHPNFEFDETIKPLSYGRKAALTRSFLRGLHGCNALYVINSNGYIGPSVTLEIGYARGINIPVWLLDEPPDDAISAVITDVMSVDRFVDMMIMREMREPANED